MSKAEDEFAAAWSEAVAGWEPERQWRFHPTRKWRLDFAWPSVKLAVEIDGVGYGHHSIAGKKADCEKHNAAVAMGWTLMRYVSGGRAAMRDAAFEVAGVLSEMSGWSDGGTCSGG